MVLVLSADAADAAPSVSHGTAAPQTSATSPFEQAIAEIASQDVHKLRTVAILARFLAQREGRYVLVRRVAISSLGGIEEGLEKRSLRKQLRFTYDYASESLIIKFMPGVEHEMTAGELTIQIRAKVAGLPGHSLLSLRSVGAAEFEVPGQLRIQGDSGLKPETRVLKSDWPSLMVEVGYSQSLPSLRCVARLWLVHSADQTRIVIIVKVSVDNSKLHVERWEMVPSALERVTRSTPPRVPAAVQSLQILANGSVNPPGSQLILPYLNIFDVPNPNAADIVFSTNDLVVLGQHIFGGLQ